MVSPVYKVCGRDDIEPVYLGICIGKHITFIVFFDGIGSHIQIYTSVIYKCPGICSESPGHTGIVISDLF